MTRKEIILQKLHSLTEDEQRQAIKQLTLHVESKLRINRAGDRTKSGAHSEFNLGVDPLKYYVSESIKRLYDPDGWDWKFEKFTLEQQLARIADKLISDSVSSFKRKKEKSPIFIDKDVSEQYDIQNYPNEIYYSEEFFKKFRDLAFEVSEDDEILFYFTTLYFDNKDFNCIAKELGIPIEEVYAKRKKLVRRLMKLKDKLFDE